MASIDELLRVMAELRHPERGCPWDLEQDFASIAPYTIEEAYEVADAIARGDMAALHEELGDLLLQVAYHAQMAAEAGHFDFASVAASVAGKMIARHPHVFGEATIADAQSQSQAWEAGKEAERRRKLSAGSLLDDLPLGFPALLRAAKLQKRAARGGFDWPNAGPIFAKIAEELDELKEAIAGRRRERIVDEFGDVVFAMVNLARHLEIDPEDALRGSNRKFERRFRFIEAEVAAGGQTMAETPLDRLEELWQAAKLEEREREDRGDVACD